MPSAAPFDPATCPPPATPEAQAAVAALVQSDERAGAIAAALPAEYALVDVRYNVHPPALACDYGVAYVVADAEGEVVATYYHVNAMADAADGVTRLATLPASGYSLWRVGSSQFDASVIAAFGAESF